MNIASIIVFVVLAIFLTWLIIDTIIVIVRKVKEKKQRDKQKECSNEVDTTK